MDEVRLAAFVSTVVDDLGSSISGLLVHLGDQLGLYRSMAGAGPMTAGDLADRTGCVERHVAEWLANQAAGGYVEYRGEDRYELSEEQAHVLADEESPVFMPGGFQGTAAAYLGVDKFLDAFRTGAGVGWDQHDARLFVGTERFFRPGYRANLTSSWIPALDGVEAKLRRGASVADVGCGHGASMIVMAGVYPASTFVGFDYHALSVEAAGKAAAAAGVSQRARFEVSGALDFPGSYDLVCFFDCLHDMGDPVGVLRHTRDALRPDGAVLLVEPYAGDDVEDNLNPVGRAFYGVSTVICTMASKAQDVGLALGAQAGEARLRSVFAEAGFRHFRRATETPFNLVFEARA